MNERTNHRERLLQSVEITVPRETGNALTIRKRARRCFSSVAIVSAAVYVFMTLAGMSGYSPALLLVLVGSAMSGAFIRHQDKSRLQSTLYEQCDVDRALSSIVGHFGEPGEEKNWVRYYYQVADWLINGGRFEDARTVIDMMQSDGEMEDEDDFCMTALRCKLDYLLGNREEVMDCCSHLSEIVADREPAGVYGYLYKLYMEYPKLIELEAKGEYEPVYDFYTDYQAVTSSVVPSVGVQFQLYRLARELGLDEMADRHLEYLRVKGGTTWYLREANRLAAA